MLRLWAACVLFLQLPVSCVASAPPFKLELLPPELARERGAQCLDHSPAGYYIREQDPNRWVVWLEGGGLCLELADCLKRRSMFWGSSKYWDPTHPAEGRGLTNVSPLNPFENYSHVWVPYCSGDTWLGKSAKGHASLAGMQMSGHLILETVLERLLNTTGIGSASDVVLGGSSAGGIGTFHHVDWLADTLAAHARDRDQAAPRVVGFPVEGLFFPQGYPVLFPEFRAGITIPLDGFMSSYLALLQDPWVPPACLEASKADGFNVNLCFDVSRLIRYTRTPLFIAMNRFDTFLIEAIGLCYSCKANATPASSTGKFIRFYGALMNETVASISNALPQTGWFVPSEYHHDENYYHYFLDKEKSINGVSLRAAFESWYLDRRSVVLVEPTCNEDGPCVPALAAKLDEVILLI